MQGNTRNNSLKRPYTSGRRRISRTLKSEKHGTNIGCALDHVRK
jgi:hypothetical protein